MFKKTLVAATLGLLPALASAAELDGATLSLMWGLPFAAILLSIALFPIFAPGFWHHHFGKITALWTVCFLVPFIAVFGFGASAALVVHALIAEYIPFIILLLALYTVSGGILVWGNLHGSPKLNTGILAIGTVLASIMGTTGAAMLLIRPLLKANDNRKHNVHVVVFFIFLVANVGGGLTPLGDPPLFLGFLKGVTFGSTRSTATSSPRKASSRVTRLRMRRSRCTASSTSCSWAAWSVACCCPASGNRACPST